MGRERASGRAADLLPGMATSVLGPAGLRCLPAPQWARGGLCRCWRPGRTGELSASFLHYLCGQIGSLLGFQQLSRRQFPRGSGGPASGTGARECMCHRVSRCHLSRAHSEPLTREQDVERISLVGATPPPRPPLVSDQPGRPLPPRHPGFSVHAKSGRVCAVEARDRRLLCGSASLP